MQSEKFADVLTFGIESFECRTFDHSDNSPCISTVFRALRKCKKKRQERNEILKFELAKTLINQGFSPEKTARANAHFESYPPLAVLPLFLAVSGNIIHRKTLKNKGFFRQTSPNPLLYRYFCENADFEAILARLQEIGKKTARRKSVVYTRFVRCRVSCRQENGKKSKICRWIRSHGKEPKNAEKT